jgi:hypothetical protein
MGAEIIASHGILVQIFLLFLVVGTLTPLLAKESPQAFRRWSLIYTMSFQALITMIAFTGVVALVIGEFAFSTAIMVMVVIWALMMFIEIKKYKLIKVARLDDEKTRKLLKGAFVKISVVQILFVVLMVVAMVLKAKGVISL